MILNSQLVIILFLKKFAVLLIIKSSLFIFSRNTISILMRLWCGSFTALGASYARDNSSGSFDPILEDNNQLSKFENFVLKKSAIS